MTDLKIVLQHFQDSERALNEAIRENGDAFITALFQSIFDKHPAVLKVATVGQTPSFNDGDICEHSSDYFTGEWHYSSWGKPGVKYYDFEDNGTVEEFFTGESDEDEDDEDDESEAVVIGLEAATEEDHETFRKQAAAAKGMMEVYDTIFERIYGTNYIVTAKRLADGTIEVENDEYDPGY